MSEAHNLTTPEDCNAQLGEKDSNAQLGEKDFEDCIEEQFEDCHEIEEGFIVINKKPRRARSRKRANSKAPTDPAKLLPLAAETSKLSPVAAEPTKPSPVAAASTKSLPVAAVEANAATSATMAAIFLAMATGSTEDGDAPKPPSRRARSRAASTKREPAKPKADRRAQSVGPRRQQTQRVSRGRG